MGEEAEEIGGDGFLIMKARLGPEPQLQVCLVIG
jgi:hypothetical protein